MTEINIERKKGRSIWPWLVGVAVLALLFALLRNRAGDDVAADARADSVVSETSTGAIATDTAGGRRP